jgi:hypothetical protein
MMCVGLQSIQMPFKNLEGINLDLACLFALSFHVHVCVSLKFFFLSNSLEHAA